MARTRRSTLKSIAAGLIAAVLFTLATMIALAAALVFLRFGDRLLTLLNQCVKFFAVLLGALIAVPRGSERGLATGTLLAIVYMVAGYGMYIALGGGSFSAAGMLGEILMGAAVGAVTGVVRANMHPKKRRIKNA